jgi:hypothetical protein
MLKACTNCCETIRQKNDITIGALCELYWRGDGLLYVQDAVYAGYTGLYTTTIRGQ